MHQGLRGINEALNEKDVPRDPEFDVHLADFETAFLPSNILLHYTPHNHQHGPAS